MSKKRTRHTLAEGDFVIKSIFYLLLVFFMKKLSTILLTISLLFLQSCSEAAPADAGKLRIQADKVGAYIYIDGRKKAMTGDTGWTDILLAEGEYKVKVEKKSDDGEWVYTKTRTVVFGGQIVQLNSSLIYTKLQVKKENNV